MEGERWVAIIAISWGCLYFEAVRSLWRVYIMDLRMCQRHSFGLRPTNAGLYIVHVSRTGLGGGGGVGAGDGWGFFEEAVAEVVREVCGDELFKDSCGPGGLSAGKEEQAGGG